MIPFHHFIIGLIVTVFLWTPDRCSALTSGSSELQEIMSAKSVVALETGLRLRALLTQQRETCTAQLKLKAIPTACFDLEPKREPSQLASLTRLCIAHARGSRSRLDLTRALASPALLPEACLNIARERLGDLQYIDESQHPEMSVARTSGLNLEE